MLTIATMLILIPDTHAAEAVVEPISRALPADVGALFVSAGVADAVIRSDPDAERTVLEVEPVRWAEGCAVDFSGDRTSANAAVTFWDGPAGWRCQANITVTMAGPTRLEMDIQRGSVALDGPSSPLRVTLGRGRVTGTVDGDGAHVSVGWGRIDLDGLTREIDTAVKVGRVSLAVDTAFLGTIEARVGLGRVRVDLPYGIWIDGEVSTGLGRVVQTVPYRPDAQTRLLAASTVGSIHVQAVIPEPLPEATELAAR